MGKKEKFERPIVGPEGTDRIEFEGSRGDLVVSSFEFLEKNKKIEVKKGSEYSFKLESPEGDPNDVRIITGTVENIRIGSLWAGQKDTEPRPMNIWVTTPKVDSSGKPLLDEQGTLLVNRYSFSIRAKRSDAIPYEFEIASINPPHQKF